MKPPDYIIIILEKEKNIPDWRMAVVRLGCKQLTRWTEVKNILIVD